jgi:hypothetical protein
MTRIGPAGPSTRRHDRGPTLFVESVTRDTATTSLPDRRQADEDDFAHPA